MDEKFYRDIESGCFRIYGVFKENGWFRRIPEQIAKSVSPNVYNLHTNTAGGRVRFVTDSPYVLIRTEYSPGRMSHFALSGSSGFDVYADYEDESRYEGTFLPPTDVNDGYEGQIEFSRSGKRVVTINFPLYSSVKKVFVGLSADALLETAPDYKIEKPIVYYGSSITQGGCASKPGSSYESILSRRFGCNYINLGFSGSARGEEAIGDYIKDLDMRVFVLDYDHNATTPDELAATHENLFKKVRKQNPTLPIVIMTRPKIHLTEEEEKRHQIVYSTYLRAKEQGDPNVYFISGKDLMRLVGDNGTVDNVHPTDSGFWSMAEELGKVFAKIFE